MCWNLQKGQNCTKQFQPRQFEMPKLSRRLNHPPYFVTWDTEINPLSCSQPTLNQVLALWLGRYGWRSTCDTAGPSQHPMTFWSLLVAPVQRPLLFVMKLASQLGQTSTNTVWFCAALFQISLACLTKAGEGCPSAILLAALQLPHAAPLALCGSKRVSRGEWAEGVW